MISHEKKWTLAGLPAGSSLRTTRSPRPKGRTAPAPTLSAPTATPIVHKHKNQRRPCTIRSRSERSHYIVMKKCPYCDEYMVPGRIYASGSRLPFWLSDGAVFTKWLATRRNIEECGGIMLGESTRFCDLAKKRSNTYHCAKCKVLIAFV